MVITSRSENESHLPGEDRRKAHGGEKPRKISTGSLKKKEEKKKPHGLLRAPLECGSAKCAGIGTFNHPEERQVGNGGGRGRKDVVTHNAEGAGLRLKGGGKRKAG